MRHKFLLVTVKEWLKSVLNYRSYPKNKTGYLFFGPPCRVKHIVKQQTNKTLCNATEFYFILCTVYNELKSILICKLADIIPHSCALFNHE